MKKGQKKEFNTGYFIIFCDLDKSRAVLRRKPGHEPFIFIDKKYQGDQGFILDAVIVLTGADRALSKAVRGKDIFVYMADNNKTYVHVRESVSKDCPLISIQPYLAGSAGFCPN